MDHPLTRKFQVFISSTYKDMRNERDLILKQLMRHRYIPAGMELFYANDNDAWQTIKQEIDESDFYVLIIGSRYGSYFKDSGKSYTEMEYEYAQKIEIPTICFIYKSRVAKGDKESEDQSQALENFKGRIKSECTPGYPKNKGELALAVVEAVEQRKKGKGLRPGYTRDLTKMIPPSDGNDDYYLQQTVPLVFLVHGMINDTKYVIADIITKDLTIEEFFRFCEFDNDKKSRDGVHLSLSTELKSLPEGVFFNNFTYRLSYPYKINDDSVGKLGKRLAELGLISIIEHPSYSNGAITYTWNLTERGKHLYNMVRSNLPQDPDPKKALQDFLQKH